MNEHETNPDTTAVPATDTGETETESMTEVESHEEAAEVVVSASDVTEEVQTHSDSPEVEVASEPVVTPLLMEGEASAAAVSPMAVVGAWATKAKRFVLMYKYTILAVILVLIGLLGFTYIMEKEGRIDTGIFDGLGNLTAAYTTVVKVNDEKITQKELNVSMSQLELGAAAQGVDIADPKIKDQIQTQALDMLVNTELLKQEAKARGIKITTEDVDNRLTSLKEEIGGEEVLTERMMQFGVDEKTLRHDIENELTIQSLLDQVFAEKGLEVTEEEIVAFYDEAGGEKGGLPKLEEVRAQIEAQLKSSKEQEAVTGYIEELRAKATIETLI